MSQLEAGSLPVESSPLAIKVHIAASQCVVRTAVPIAFTIKNLCRMTVDLQISLEAADFFMFAGNKLVSAFEFFVSFATS